MGLLNCVEQDVPLAGQKKQNGKKANDSYNVLEVPGVDIFRDPSSFSQR